MWGLGWLAEHHLYLLLAFVTNQSGLATADSSKLHRTLITANWSSLTCNDVEGSGPLEQNLEVLRSLL